MNHNELFFVKGLHTNNNGHVTVWVINLSPKSQVIRENWKIGKCFKVDSIPGRVEAVEGTVGVLGHQATETLTPGELQERRDFLSQQLELDNNMLLSPQQRERVLNIFLDNFDSVSVNGEDFGSSDLITFNIQTVPGAVPHKAKCRPLNPFQEADLQRQLDEWIRAGVIEPSNSEWCAAMVPCKKKGTDKLRWSIDFRPLNDVTIKDTYPLPNIETNIDKLRGAAIFSSLDSAGAYHSLHIDKKSRDLTTFVCPFGTFRFCRMPFGLSNSPAAYCRLVQKALNYLPRGFSLAYLDDILIYSKSVDDHFDHLEQVVKLHAKVGMKLNLKKCKLFRTEVDYLGFRVSAGGVGMIPEYVQRVLEWPVPKTNTELQSFLGFANYYRSFIPSFSTITACLNKLRNEPKLDLKDQELDAIQTLKLAFTKAPIRAYPDYYSIEPFILSVDYSRQALAGILTQVQGGTERFIGAFSKACDAAEQNYAAHKGEAASIVYCLRKWEHVLRAKKFIIRTDSRALTFLNNLKEARGLWARWQVFLASFNFDIEHKAGRENVCADALSRSRAPVDSECTDEVYKDDPLSDLADIYAMEAQDVMSQISTEEWKLKTRTDYDLSIVISYVKEKKLPSKEERRRLPTMANQLLNRFPLLSVSEDLLWFTNPLIQGRLRPARIVVPSALQNRIVAAAHSTGPAHAGISETYRKLQTRCYFPGMFNLTRIYVNSCVSCLQKINKLGKNQHVMHEEILSYPMQRVYLDTIGPLSTCRHQGVIFKHILTVLDGFTRYLVAIPVGNIESTTLLSALQEHFFFKFGYPEIIHCDRGTSLTSALFEGSLKALGVGLTHCPPYSPEGNRVERSHKTLGALLRADDSTSPGAWVSKLNGLVFGMNTAVCTRTNVSPYFAMFGRNPRLPLDVLFPFPTLTHQVRWTQHVTDLHNKFRTISRDLSRLECRRLSFNNEIKSPRIQYGMNVGDIVFYFTPRAQVGLSKKLTCRWTGPYRILRVVSDSLSVIFPFGNWMSRPREISALNSRLKRLPNYDKNMDSSTPLSDGVDSDVESENGIVDVTNYDSQRRSNTYSFMTGGLPVHSDSEEDGLIAGSAESPHQGSAGLYRGRTSPGLTGALPISSGPEGPVVKPDPEGSTSLDPDAPDRYSPDISGRETPDVPDGSDLPGDPDVSDEPDNVAPAAWDRSVPVPLEVRRLGPAPAAPTGPRSAAAKAMDELARQLRSKRRIPK